MRHPILLAALIASAAPALTGCQNAADEPAADAGTQRPPEARPAAEPAAQPAPRPATDPARVTQQVNDLSRAARHIAEVAATRRDAGETAARELAGQYGLRWPAGANTAKDVVGRLLAALDRGTD